MESTASTIPVELAPLYRGDGDDDFLYEIHDGNVVEIQSMAARSGDVCANLQDLMRPYAKSKRLGRVVPEQLFILDPDSREGRRPDLCFISNVKYPLDALAPSGDWELVPDLAVEIVSTHDKHEELRDKVREYFEYGVKEVWVVCHTAKEITVSTGPRKHVMLTEDDILKTKLLPGWKMRVGDIF